jgi:IS5 family transposase
MAVADRFNRAFLPEGNKGRPPFSLANMLRTHFLQQWSTLSDLGMAATLFDEPLYRYLLSFQSSRGCPSRASSLGRIIGWKNTSWPNKS